MLKNEILMNQAKLFNNILIDEQIKYIVNNNLLIYDDFTNINFDDSSIILLEEITWIYDENNYRIPYLNGIKVRQIKLNENNNIFDYISSSSLISNNDIICGDNFLRICDVFIGSINSINANPNNVKIQKNIINIETNIHNTINKNNVIFVKTDDLSNFYTIILHNKIDINNKIILTHNSDYEIDSKYINVLNIVKNQYSQNCLISHKNLTPIPIGIENNMWFDHEILHKIRNRNNINKEKGIYFYFSLSTHFSRNECYEKLKNKLVWNTKLSKEEYFIELKKHKYAICPRGNGTDTHRIWECLYLDVIPIMLKQDYFGIDKLPIIYLNNWDELDINNINTQFKNIQFSKITIDYYKNNIKTILKQY
jgi:hypothetical protein